MPYIARVSANHKHKYGESWSPYSVSISKIRCVCPAVTTVYTVRLTNGINQDSPLFPLANLKSAGVQGGNDDVWLSAICFPLSRSISCSNCTRERLLLHDNPRQFLWGQLLQTVGFPNCLVCRSVHVPRLLQSACRQTQTWILPAIFFRWLTFACFVPQKRLFLNHADFSMIFLWLFPISKLMLGS